jgi:hypothetical protein
MKVLISWSGERSRQVATVLRDWLPSVIQAIEPWMSEQDIDKGATWPIELFSQLEKTKAGVTVLTRENLPEPWLQFEAGALAKTIERTMVCTFLVGLKPTDVNGPLSLFQATEPTVVDVRRLMVALNRRIADEHDRGLSEPQLEKAFAMFWPQLETAVKEIAATAPPAKRVRSTEDMLEEILASVRQVGMQVSTSSNFANARYNKLLVGDLLAGDYPAYRVALLDAILGRLRPDSTIADLYGAIGRHEIRGLVEKTEPPLPLKQEAEKKEDGE